METDLYTEFFSFLLLSDSVLLGLDLVNTEHGETEVQKAELGS